MSVKPKAVAVSAPPSTEDALPGATYRDAFALAVPGRIGAREAARRTLGILPGWVRALMGLRNALVMPFGLRRGPSPEHAEHIGFFPVLSDEENRIVLGLDDRHLDFRLVVDTEPLAEGGTRITATTLVKVHGLLGRAYLAAILPFHRAIVPAALNQAA